MSRRWLVFLATLVAIPVALTVWATTAQDMWAARIHLPIISKRPAPAATGVLTVLVHFVEFSLPGVSPNNVLAKLQSDLQAELAPEIAVQVKATDENLLLRLDAARENLLAAHRVAEARQAVAELVRASENVSGPAGPEVAAARAELAARLRAVEAEAASRGNWAEVPQGTVFLSIRPGRVYGGKTAPGELWAIIHTGLAPLVFPAPAQLRGETPAAFDFNRPEFLPYHASYDDAARSAFLLQYVANVAKQQLAVIFGRPLKEDGSLLDPLRATLALARAEHFERDRQPLRFAPDDRQAVITSILKWSAAP